VNAFVKVGMDARFEPGPGEEPKDLQQMVDEGVRRAYLDPDNKLRASILADPAGARKNTKDNTPAVVNVELVKGATVDVTVAAKGGGSEARASSSCSTPRTLWWIGCCRQSLLWVRDGAAGNVGHRHWRHGREGDALAKQSLMDPINIQELIARGAKNRSEEMRIELYDR